jgi:hypothetical protein
MEWRTWPSGHVHRASDEPGVAACGSRATHGTTTDYPPGARRCPRCFPEPYYEDEGFFEHDEVER